jgi:hypothetical protein
MEDIQKTRTTVGKNLHSSLFSWKKLTLSWKKLTFASQNPSKIRCFQASKNRQKSSLKMPVKNGEQTPVKKVFMRMF